MDNIEMKTFNDIEFVKHQIATDLESVENPLPKGMLDKYKDCKQGTIILPNGYQLSVLFGDIFYSNGVDTYEVAVVDMMESKLTNEFFDDKDDSVLGYQTKEEIDELIKRIQLSN